MPQHVTEGCISAEIEKFLSLQKHSVRFVQTWIICCVKCIRIEKFLTRCVLCMGHIQLRFIRYVWTGIYSGFNSGLHLVWMILRIETQKKHLEPNGRKEKTIRSKRMMFSVTWRLDYVFNFCPFTEMNICFRAQKFIEVVSGFGQKINKPYKNCQSVKISPIWSHWIDV